MELSSGLARRRTTATQWKTQPASSATEKAQEVQSEEVSPVIPKLLECGRTRNGKRNAQLITESSIIPKLQECTRAKKPIMDTHEVWDQVNLCDQPSGLTASSDEEVQSEEVSPVIPKLLECGRTRNGKRNAQLITESPIIPKLQECTRAKKPIMDTNEVWDQVHLCDQPSGYTAGSDESEEASPGIPKLQECGQTRKGKRDAQLVTESPVIPKLQERTRAKKPKMDSHDLQLSPSVATVQKHAQRKKRKRPKVWVQVRLYDQPGGLRTKEDVTMYDIYLSLALEIIEVNRQQCQSKKGKKVMDQFYKEVAKDAIGMIDELQLYTNELVELQQEIMKMMRLRKELDRISRGLGKYVRENDIRNVDPYQFYFEDEEDYYV
ncbi:uncharacterized protein LOC119187747 isoform X5 [Rhipicephalus microplus]